MGEYIIKDGELYHFGVKGMKWGVRRSKAQLARLTKRDKKDISDEEAEQFKQDVRSVRKHKVISRQLSDEYARALNKQSRREQVSKGITSTATSLAVIGAVSYVSARIGMIQLMRAGLDALEELIR